jgi:type I restriction enzyme R subunit/putative DNA methylase
MAAWSARLFEGLGSVCWLLPKSVSEHSQEWLCHAFVVMANHVHLLITPLCSVARLTKGLKGASDRECNKILGRTGDRFWQHESFDHWVRTTGEFNRIRAYIE